MRIPCIAVALSAAAVVAAGTPLRAQTAAAADSGARTRTAESIASAPPVPQEQRTAAGQVDTATPRNPAAVERASEPVAPRGADVQVVNASPEEGANGWSSSVLLSVIAAGLSAVAAGLSFWIAFRTYNLLEDDRIDTFRPEVLLIDWSVTRPGDSGHTGELRVDRVTNVGQGPALSFGIFTRRIGSGPVLTRPEAMFVRDVRPQEVQSLFFRIGIKDPPADGRFTADVAIFWTDLHEKKHLVVMSLRAVLGGDEYDPSGHEHVLLPGKLFMTGREARVFRSEAELRRWLNETASPSPADPPRRAPEPASGAVG